MAAATKTILKTKMPIISHIEANLRPREPVDMTYGHLVNLAANQEIKAGKKTNLEATPPVINTKIVDGWKKRGLVGEARQVVTVVSEFVDGSESEFSTGAVTTAPVQTGAVVTGEAAGHAKGSAGDESDATGDETSDDEDSSDAGDDEVDELLQAERDKG